MSTDGYSSLDEIAVFGDEMGYPWPMAAPDRGMMADLNVYSQSTKIAFDSNGTVIYRDGFGKGDPESWRSLFERLADSG